MIDDEREFEAAARQIKRLQRPERTPRGMSKLVSQVIARRGIAQATSNEDVARAWRLSCNGQWSDQTRVGPIRRGRLEIQVANSLVNQELNFEKSRLLESMREKMPHAKLKDISFRVAFFFSHSGMIREADRKKRHHSQLEFYHALRPNQFD